MHRPLFVLAAGSVAAVGALVVASAMPAGAATSIRAELASSCTTVAGQGNGTPCSVGTAHTPVTFSITSTGVLAITAPDGTSTLGGPLEVNLGGIVSGTAGTIGFAGNFGAVTVTDDRALDPADWIATVSSTDFANTTTSADTILASAATYITGTISAVTGTGALPLAGGANGGQIVDDTAANGGTRLTAGIPMSATAQGVVTETNFDGDNAATWTPTIDVTIPTNAVAGVYTGTVTHSVT